MCIRDRHYIYQELTRLPEGYAVPEGRQKPWGTAHAVACCRGVVDAPFAAINADDFYGRGAFEAVYRFLKESTDEHAYCMAGYRPVSYTQLDVYKRQRPYRNNSRQNGKNKRCNRRRRGWTRCV